MSDTGIAMRETISELRLLNYDLTSMKALDLFARSGSWQTLEYAQIVSHITAWEINDLYARELRKNLPQNSKIEIGNSHDMIKICKEKYDLIVSDNPMGCYGDYCEHFDIFDDMIKVSKEQAVLIFNVKTVPFDYENKTEWKKRRNYFYSIDDASFLDDKFIIDFYSSKIAQHNKKINHVIWKKRPQEEGLYLLTMCIESKL